MVTNLLNIRETVTRFSELMTNDVWFSCGEAGVGSGHRRMAETAWLTPPDASSNLLPIRGLAGGCGVWAQGLAVVCTAP